MSPHCYCCTLPLSPIAAMKTDDREIGKYFTYSIADLERQHSNEALQSAYS